MPRTAISRWAGATLREAAWAPSLVFLLHVVAFVVFDLYHRVPYFDVPMHVIGGVVIAYFFHRASINASRFGIIGPYHPVTHVTLVIALVFTATVLWEFAEYAYDRAFETRHQVSLDDTLGDMLLGVLGGVAFVTARGLRGGPAAQVSSEAELAASGSRPDAGRGD